MELFGTESGIGPVLDDQEYTEFKRILSKNGYKYLEIRSDN